MQTTPRKPLTLHALRQMHEHGEKIAMLTCYDASFAKLLDAAGVDTLLVGDSLGMVLQGHTSTLPVTLEEVCYHTQCISRLGTMAWRIADMPFGSYQAGKEQAIRHATRLMQAGAQMVKMEGGSWTVETVHFLVERGIPVCAHLGLTPQSVHALGGYRIQGKTPNEAARVLEEAQALSDAGAAMMVLELMPSDLARRITQSVAMPTIGIGAGPDCSGQVLVLHDMLGITGGKLPRFVKNFLDEGSEKNQGKADADEAKSNAVGSIPNAIRRYVQAVKTKTFPAEGEHTY